MSSNKAATAKPKRTKKSMDSRSVTAATVSKVISSRPGSAGVGNSHSAMGQLSLQTVTVTACIVGMPPIILEGDCWSWTVSKRINCFWFFCDFGIVNQRSI